MEFRSIFTHPINGSVRNQESNNKNNCSTLFDKNLKRINNNLISVNEYYTPQFDYSVENQSKIIDNEDLNELLEEEVDQSMHMYNEFHKIAKNEFEFKRKMQVRRMLNEKFSVLDCKRKEYSCSPTYVNKPSNHSFSKELFIDKNYNEKLLDPNNDQLQSRLHEEQSKINQKTRNIKFTLLLNVALKCVDEIKNIFNENPSESLSSQVQEFKLFEASIQKFRNLSPNANENDLLALHQLIENIQIFHEQLMKSVKNSSFKAECSKNEDNSILYQNFSFKINEHNDDKNNFTFKIDDVKSDEFTTFKFNTNEKVDDTNILNFSFKTDDTKHDKVKNNTSYNFEIDYKQFIENHLELQKYLKQIEKMYYSFLNDDKLKSLRQELVKSINTPVNSISSVSSWHMKDKFDRLDALLKCKTVKTGNSSVSAKSHPDALIFCKDTLAKKIINMGEQVASVKTETAFEVASIVTELWKVHPDFGILLYARFKLKCPCLIPYNAAKTDEETDEEYYKSLCYNYTNGVVEKQDKYVKRMTGIIRLFAAILVTESKSGKALGIGQAWMLIAATVNLVPQLDVTAVFLHEMLVITGYYLKQAYGRQFIKMLRFIEINYMKKIDEVTPIGCGGPVQRLKTFITKAIEVGYIEKPKGILSPKFW